jgi:hypothetical protein
VAAENPPAPGGKPLDARAIPQLHADGSSPRCVSGDTDGSQPNVVFVQTFDKTGTTFGDEDDPQSAMMRRRIDNKLRRYLVLEEINTGPNVTYLRDIYQTKGKA